MQDESGMSLRALRLAAVLLLLIGILFFAWGLDLVVTADWDPDGTREKFGWILTIFGVGIAGLALLTFKRAASRSRVPSRP